MGEGHAGRRVDGHLLGERAAARGVDPGDQQPAARRERAGGAIEDDRLRARVDRLRRGALREGQALGLREHGRAAPEEPVPEQVSLAVEPEQGGLPRQAEVLVASLLRVRHLEEIDQRTGEEREGHREHRPAPGTDRGVGGVQLDPRRGERGELPVRVGGAVDRAGIDEAGEGRVGQQLRIGGVVTEERRARPQRVHGGRRRRRGERVGVLQPGLPLDASRLRAVVRLHPAETDEVPGAVLVAGGALRAHHEEPVARLQAGRDAGEIQHGRVRGQHLRLQGSRRHRVPVGARLDRLDGLERLRRLALTGHALHLDADVDRDAPGRAGCVVHREGEQRAPRRRRARARSRSAAPARGSSAARWRCAGSPRWRCAPGRR